MDGRAYYETYWSEQGYCPQGATTPEIGSLLATYLPPGCRCLDVGCGDGRTAGLWLREHGHAYVGVDISDNAVRQATALGLDARRIEDAAGLPFESGSFDAAVAIEVLEHVFLPQLVLAEIHRVLRPGGVLLVTVPNVAYWRRRLDLALLGRWNPFGDDRSVEQPWRDPHIRFFNPGALRRLLGSTGFEPIRVRGHGGAVLRDLPLGRRLWRGRPTRAYQVLERRMPALLGLRIDAVAVRAEEGRGAR